MAVPKIDKLPTNKRLTFAQVLSWSRTQAGRHVMASVIFGAVTCLFFFPVFVGQTQLDVASRQNDIFPWAYKRTSAPATLHYDQADTFYPWQVFMSNALQSGQLPLWNPYSFAGQPFFANGQNGVLYLPRTILSLITSPARVHDLLLLSHMFLGGLFMYLLLAELSLSFPASVFGAIAWMANSFMLSWMALEHFIVVEAWLPLIILLLWRAVTKSSWAASVGSGVVLALVFLGGNILFVEIVLLASGGFAAYLLLRKWWEIFRGRAARATARLVLNDLAIVAVPFLLCLGLAAIQLLPTLELGQAIDRRPLNYDEFLGWKLEVSSLVYFFVEPDLRVAIPNGFATDPYHQLLFLGTPTALLALVGLWRKHPVAHYARALAIITLLVAVGTPATWLAYKFLPGFSYLKPLARVLFMFNFAAAILAGFGLDWVVRRRLGAGRWRLNAKWQPAWKFGLACALASIVVLQLYSFGARVIRYQTNDASLLYPETPLIQALKKIDEARFLPMYPAFLGSTQMGFGLYSAAGYDSLVPDRTVRLWRVVRGENLDKVVRQPLPDAFVSWYSERWREDLFPRLSITHVVTAPSSPLPGAKKSSPNFFAFSLKYQLAGEWLVPLAGDWDGDGVDTVGMYDARTSTFHLSNSTTSGLVDFTIQYKEPGRQWVPLAGDWNGDGVDTVGLYDQKTSMFFLSNSGAGGPGDPAFPYNFSKKQAIPICGDWDGDGVDTVGVYNPSSSTFHLKNSNTYGGKSTDFGFGMAAAGWVPIVGDWDEDGLQTVGLYNPQTGLFYLRNSTTEGIADSTFQHGPVGAKLTPLIGSWLRDGGVRNRDSIGLYDAKTNTFYLGTPTSLDPSVKHLYRAKDGDIYEVKDSMPRAYVVYAHESVKSSVDALRRFTDPSFDPSKGVIVEESYLSKAAVAHTPDGPVVAGQPGDARVIERSLNGLTLKVTAAQDGWLVVDETWDPGWRAAIDGAPATIIPGNYAFRALRVKAGEHTVEMWYQPTAFRTGLMISLVSLTLAAGFGVFRASRRLKRSRKMAGAESLLSDVPQSVASES